MKRPISILCLADIHYDANGDMSVFETLYSEFVKYIDEDKNRIKWMPDYIVIAGDVADKNGGYENVTKFLETLRSKESFNIASDHVIVVPGNHDKNTRVKITKHQEDKKAFDEYCNNAGNISNFGCLFAERFREYINFSKQYTSDLQFNSKDVLDEQLKCLSGVKVFDDDHICFLYVNTEWLYVPGRDKAKITKKESGEDISEFVRIDENCLLCAPLIKDACDFIKKNYPTYTVVTVMHRGFDHFSLEEKNPTDAASIDSIGYLLKFSDIIITGHDHVFTPAPPTLIRNHVQHFQLGAVGRKEHKTTEYQRSAEIIRLNISSEKVEQLFINYKNINTDFRWCFEESARDYPLFSKFLSKNEVAKALPYYHDTIVRAKSSSTKDVERAIFTYFCLSSSHELKPLAADTDIKSKLEELLAQQNEEKSLYIVIYYRFHEHIEDANAHNSLIVSIKEQIDQFKNEHIKRFMSYKIIINEVIVEYPLEND